ncbi:MAG: endoribonuclease YicC domain-containing protein, partial [Stellaceae bacterium]
PRLDGLLALRGVVETVEDEDDAVVAARGRAVLAGWTAVLDRLATARAEEGRRIGALLQAQLDEIGALLAAAESSAAAQPAAIRERLLTVLASLADVAPTMSEERVAQEVAMLAARSDIREEIERLRAHLEQAAELLGEGEAIGRRLDFLCQELNREANTLCSKSADIALTRAGLALKAVIEQFREQVQNIE